MFEVSRRTNFQPAVIERFQRSERALIAVIREAFVRGTAPAAWTPSWPIWA